MRLLTFRLCVIRTSFYTFLFMMLLFSSATTFTPVNAQGTLSTGAELSALERHLFTETFPTDTTDQRLDRLDKFVFGRVRSGSDSQRLDSLMIDVPTAHGDPDADSDAPAPAANKSEGQPVLKAEKPDDSVPIDYPTVSALEKEILGHTEESLPIQERLSKLEVKAFGKASDTTSDLAIRVDRLKAYESSKNGNNDDYLASSSPISANTNAPAQALDISSQLDLLEKNVFAKTYSRDGITSRLDRLEKTIYPSKPVETFTSVPDRVSRLMSALGLQNSTASSRRIMHTPTYAESIPTPKFSYPLNNGGTSVESTSAPAHHSFWHKVGSVLGGIGEAAAMTMGSGMYYGGYPGYGYGGMYGGYPYGGMYGGGMYGGGMYGSPFNRGMYW